MSTSMFHKKKPGFNQEAGRKILHKNLSFAGAEQYKLLRTNLIFALPEEKCPIIGVTSSVRGEGKSVTAINLSYALAETGKKVVLIDGDMRLPSVAQKMGIAGTPGLTDLLLGYESQHISVFKSKQLDNWYVIPAGELPPNPSELLGSQKMARLLDVLRTEFDYIILDLPPVNLVSDALAVSKHITGMVLVVRQDYTEKRALDNCVRQLQTSNVKVLGTVFNGSRNSSGSYGKYNKYYQPYISNEGK